MKIYVLILYGFIHLTNAGENFRNSLDPFRLLTNQFLRTVQPNTSAMNVTAGLLVHLNNRSATPLTPMDYVNMYWQPYLGYIILAILGALFLILFPLVGICFCSCRVCGKRCGAQTSIEAQSNMKRKRIAFNIFLFIFTSMILIGAIISMASNFIFLDSLKSPNETDDKNGNIFHNLNSTMSSFSVFINTATRNLMVNSVAILRKFIDDALLTFTPVIDTFINTFTSKIKSNDLITSTQNFIKSYAELQKMANEISGTASQHRDNSTSFITYINDVRSQLTTILTNETCFNITSCPGVRNQLQYLVIGFNMSNINYTNDISAVQIFSAYSVADLQSSLDKTVATLTDITNTVKSNFTSFLTTFIGKLNSSSLVANFQTFINKSIQPLSKQFDSYQNSILSVQIFSFGTVGNGGLYTLVSYVCYGLCALISVILVVVLLFYIGLCYGMCGETDFEDAARCNKGRGSYFLISGVGISFIFGWLIMLVTIGMFLPGGLLNTEVCSYLTTNDSNQIKTVDAFTSYLTKQHPIVIGHFTLPNLDFYQSISTRCPNSPDLLSAFQVPKEFIQSLVNYIYHAYVDGPINSTIANINNYTVQSIDTKGLDDSLKNMTDLNSKLQHIISVPTETELKKPVTTLPSVSIFLNGLAALIAELKAKNKTDRATKVSDATADLNNKISSMSVLQTKYSNEKTAFDTAIKNFGTSLTTVKKNLEELKSQPNNAKNEAVVASQIQLRQTVRNSVNSTFYKVIISIGDCKDMSTSFSKAASSACITFLGPFNNIWMGMGWFLLFIIPAIIFAIKLGDLYRVSHIESSSAAYNHAYMSSNQFLTKESLEMIRRPQRA